MSEVRGTQDIEKLGEIVAKGFVVGKKVWADKEVSLKDLVHAPEAIEFIKELVEFVASKPELVQEVKDISVTEFVALVAKGDELVKKVEEA